MTYRHRLQKCPRVAVNRCYVRLVYLRVRQSTCITFFLQTILLEEFNKGIIVSYYLNKTIAHTTESSSSFPMMMPYVPLLNPQGRLELI
jgi:hypothetical protein